MLTGLFIGLAVLVVSIIVAGVNFAVMSKRALSLDIDGFGSGMTVHVLSGVGATLGTLCALVCGIGFLVEKFGH